ncbi:MAG: hypothetical protein JNJ99_16700 [Crocinitomicaceae bacterium]|nr:hypothetical protein [Crocinitomicaceae bacterium]
MNIELDPNHYFGNHGDDGPYSFLDSTLARYSLLSINLPFSCKINLTRNGNISIFTGFSFDLGVYSLKKVIFSRIHQFYKDQPDDLTLSQNAHFYPIDNSHFNHKWNINYICKIRFNLSSKGEYDYSFTPNLKISLTNNYGYLGQPGKNYISGIVNLGHLTNFYFYSFGCEFSFWKKQL